MGQQGIQIESLVVYGWPEIVCQKNQIDSLVQTVHIFSEDIGRKFGIKNCRVFIMERRKIIRTDGIRLPDE